jgi:tetratricopeptide (TPR) repeat protein
VHLARQLNDPIVLQEVLSSHLGSCIGEPLPERSTWSDELEELTESTGSEWERLIAFHYRAALAAEEGDAESLHRAVAHSDDLRFDAFEALAFDPLDQAETIVLKGVEEGRFGEGVGQFGILLWWQDRLNECIGAAEALLQQQPNLDAARAALASVLAASGRRVDAREQLARLAPEGVLRVRDDIYRNGTVALMTETMYTMRDSALVPQLRTQMAQLSGRLVTLRYIVALGSADRYLGMHHALLGQFEAAFAAFEKALELELRFGSSTLASQTRLAYAYALARSGRTDDAASQAHAASRSAEETGVAFVIRGASELLSPLV